MDSNLASEKRFALLIDSDNVSSKYIKLIINELSRYGTITYKRCYGDWTQPLHSKWKKSLLENSITPIQQFAYTTGKNATDSAMIIDAMDILYTNSVEGFCIVSSDSDFTRLASRLRESGVSVVGMGEHKTPLAFRKACDIFTTLELLESESDSPKDGSTSLTSRSPMHNTGPGIEKVEREVRAVITDNLNSGKTTSMGEVGHRLVKRYPDFDVRSYGTNQLSKLLGEFSSIKVVKEGNNLAVELVESKENGSSHGKKKSQRKKNQVKRLANSSARENELKKASNQKSADMPEGELMSALGLQVESFIVSQVQKAGDKGITVSELSNKTRSRFKDFRIRTTGFASFRTYLGSLSGVIVEKNGSDYIAKVK